MTTQTVQSMHSLRWPFGVQPPARNTLPCPNRATQELADRLGVEIGYSRNTTEMVVLGARASEAIEALILDGWCRSHLGRETISDDRITMHMCRVIPSEVRGLARDALAACKDDDRRSVRECLGRACHSSSVRLDLDGARQLTKDETVRELATEAISALDSDRRHRAAIWTAA